MTMFEAVRTVLSKYAVFRGRARRSEYWYFWLFCLCVYFAAWAIGSAVGLPATLRVVADLALLLPNIAVAVRRLHDLDKTGWWALLVLIPWLGGLILLYFFVQKGTTGENRYGDDPAVGNHVLAEDELA